MKAQSAAGMRLIHFNFCLFIHTSALCSSCFPADPAVIFLLLSRDWLGALAVRSNFLVCPPIRVVCFVCVSKCCGCHSISRIILGCLNRLHILLPSRAHTHVHTRTHFKRGGRAVFSAAWGPWCASVSDGYGSSISSVGFCRSVLSTTGICQTCSAEPTHSAGWLLLLLAMFLI